MTPTIPNYHHASASPAAQQSRPTLYHQQSSGYQSQATPTPATQPAYMTNQQLHAAPTYQATTPSYGNSTPVQPYQRQTIQQVQAQQAAQHQQQQQYQQQQQQAFPQYPVATPHERQHEAYVLSDAANAALPGEIRNQFPQDDEGRVLFFTRPPFDTHHVVSGHSEAGKGEPLVHTKSYLDAKAERDAEINTRKRAIQESLGVELEKHSQKYKRLKSGAFDEEREVDGRIKANPAKAAQILTEYQERRVAAERKQQEQLLALKAKAVQKMCDNMIRATAVDYVKRYGDKAAAYAEEDVARWKERDLLWQQDEAMRAQEHPNSLDEGEQIASDTKRMLSQDFWTGRYSDGTGRFEDDYDNRLPRPS